MRYHITMLCGGQSMMLTPSDPPVFGMDRAKEVMGDSVLRSSDDMLEFMFRDVKITIYPNGSIMFYHFTDAEASYAYADEIIGMITERE